MGVDYKKVIVTGSAGFIGFHLAKRLLNEGVEVCGIDGLTNYYDVALKKDRNRALEKNNKYSFENIMLENKGALMKVCLDFNPDIIIHLAAQAGVRYSIENPQSYMDSNLQGTLNLLEALRVLNCRHFLMASTSSVYGANTKRPYKEIDKTDTQMSFYAATKKANEVMTHSYSHLFNIPTTCFRFFTVYGPWGRPDMALFKFTKNALEGSPIDVFNYGKMKRDFTYIDDLVNAIIRLTSVAPSNDSNQKKYADDTLSSVAPWRAVNIGSSRPVDLNYFIDVLEQNLNLEIKKNYIEMQAGDVPSTFANTELLEKLTDFRPEFSVEEGVKRFVSWYKKYNKIGE